MTVVEYETQVVRPADGRIASLPRPAVNLAQRMAQLSAQRGHGRQDMVEVRVVIVDGAWFLLVDGRTERLGAGE